MSPSEKKLRDVIAKFGREFEVDTECTCHERSQTAPITATGHKVGCKVDSAVRAYLAEGGIV